MLRKVIVFVFVPIALVCLLALALALPLLVSAQKASAAGAPDDPLVGYGAGTTGGAGGPTTTVSTLSALESAVSGSSPKIVQVSGTITGAVNVMVGSNTSVIGLGSTASLVGISLNLVSVSNVIVRNLSISFVQASNTTGDAIHIQQDTNHVWIDHNNLFSDQNHGKDFYDGLIDITHAADFITVSWNQLHDHFKTSLIGHSDSNGAEDTGHFHVTYHHNWFFNDNSRMPSIRFGTLHAYNNYFQNVGDSAIHTREGAQALIENNVFDGTGTAITTTGDSAVDGFANARGNIYNGATVDITQVGTFTQAPYSYTLDPVTSVVSEVTAFSGVGIISGSGGGSTPTPGTTPTQGTTPTATPTPGTTPTPTPTPPAGSIFQAENASLSNASVATTFSGYTGSGYVVFGGPGGSIQWTVSIPSTGKYSLVFRYSNAASNNLPASVSVNGTVIKADLTFKSTGSGSSWSTTQTSGTVPGGTVTIKLTAGSSGGSNIDYLQIVSA